MTTINLRPYQQEAIDACQAAWALGQRRLLVTWPTGAGKQQPVDEPVLAPGGWRPIGSLTPGDLVIGAGGASTVVTGIYPQGRQPVLRVVFNDGSWTRCGPEHLWTVQTKYDRSDERTWRTIPTSEIAERLHLGWHIPMVAPVDYGAVSLPVGPYLLGVLLGDGCFIPDRVSLTTDTWIIDRLGLPNARPHKTCGYVSDVLVSGRQLRGNLRALGLWAKGSHEKFIPPAYLLGTPSERLALLRGLLDTDGSPTKSGGIEFCSTSRALADGVAELAQSLGGTARMGKERRTWYTHNGERRQGRPSWRVGVALPADTCPFLLPRKAARWSPATKYRPARVIRSIQPEGECEQVCISVANPNGLYVTRSHIVTHNTVLFSHIIKDRLARGQRALVIAHRGELLDQAMRTMLVVDPWTHVGRVQANRNGATAKVVYASVQTIANAARRQQLGEFGLVVVDECHHGSAASYREVLADLGCWADGGPDLLGVTATMDRADGRDLAHIFETVAHSYSIGDAIAAGYLAPPRGRLIATDLDMSKVRTVAGDYNAADLGAEMERVDIGGAIVRAWQDWASERSRTVVFVPLVAIAESVARSFAAQGIDAAAVHGSMRPADRRRTLSARHRVLVNAMLLCLDDQTEILTDQGWTGIDEMTAGHKVANWDQGKVWFEEPLDIVRRDRGPDEDMYVLETRHRSIRVTHGHRMLYRTTTGGRWLKSPVQDLSERKLELPLGGSADSLPVTMPDKPLTRRGLGAHAHRVSASAYNLRSREGYDWDESLTEARRRVARREGLRYSHPSILTLDECRFIGFWIGDGSRNALLKGGVEYTLSQAVVYPHIIRWVDDVLAACGLDVVRRDRSDWEVPHTQWSLPRGTGGGSQQRNGVYHMEPYLNKAGSNLLWGLDHDRFDAFLEGLWMADGDHLDGQKMPTTLRIVSASRSLLDLLQAVACVRGWAPRLVSCGPPQETNHRQRWTLVLSRRLSHRIGGKDPSWRIHREQEPWRPERVWCVKTPARNIITRRRDTVTVMGNTEGWDDPEVDCIVWARPTQSRALFQQSIGRGLRLYPGKAECLVLDLIGSSGTHDLAGVSTLYPPGAVESAIECLTILLAPKGKKRRATEVARLAAAQGIGRESLNMASRELELDTTTIDGEKWVSLPTGERRPAGGGAGPQAGVTMLDMEALGGAGVVGVDMMSRARFAWQRSGDGWSLPGGVRLVVDESDRWSVLADDQLLGDGLDLPTAMGVAEDHVRATGGAVLADRHAPWRAQPPSDKQAELLRKFRREVPETKGEAADLLDRLFARKKGRR